MLLLLLRRLWLQQGRRSGRLVQGQGRRDIPLNALRHIGSIPIFL